ncbi:MAG: glycosyltransferase family 4 protein [Treponema sp.]|nr:glycosyltransferase family 4 protein [Treponema sp.]
MTITIDCRMINSSGIGVYLRGCLPYFLKSADNFILIGDREQLKSYSSDNVKIIDCKIKPFSIKETFFFPASVLKQINKTSLFYSPFFNIPHGIKIPVYTTIHDIIFPDMPELSSKAGLAARMWFFRRSYKKSKKIFTVSRFSKSRIEHYLGSSKPVIVTHSAIQQTYLEYRENIKNIHKKDTIVFIGNIKKHKGLNCLLDAFLPAKNEGLPHKLIIIGSKENFRTSDTGILKKIESVGEDFISFTGFISDDALMKCLSETSLLVQPSLYEGFCLPPLEAMILGTNALISDIPVLKEIYADYPVTFFKTGDSGDLKNKLTDILLNKKASSPALSHNMISKYTFDKTVSIILKELE